jgi:hypothetical protein
MSAVELIPWLTAVAWPMVAGAVAAIPPPDPSSKWFVVYKLANFLALNVGNAANKSYPVKDTQDTASDAPQFPSDRVVDHSQKADK